MLKVLPDITSRPPLLRIVRAGSRTLQKLVLPYEYTAGVAVVAVLVDCRAYASRIPFATRA